MSAVASKNVEDFPVPRLPIEVEDGKDRFRISPVILIEHARRGENRELEKNMYDDFVEYRVFSGVEYSENDPTQMEWDKEYGIRCFENGLLHQFVDYDPVHSKKSSAQATISDRVFTELEARTLRYYARNGLEEAAEILRGEREEWS